MLITWLYHYTLCTSKYQNITLDLRNRYNYSVCIKYFRKAIILRNCWNTESGKIGGSRTKKAVAWDAGGELHLKHFIRRTDLGTVVDRWDDTTPARSLPGKGLPVTDGLETEAARDPGASGPSQGEEERGLCQEWGTTTCSLPATEEKYNPRPARCQMCQVPVPRNQRMNSKEW